MNKFIQERTMFKVLVERTGALFSVTTRQRAYFFFISTQLVGARVAPTTDPYPGIVELCHYDITTIVRKWGSLARVKLKSKTKPTSDQTVSFGLLSEGSIVSYSSRQPEQAESPRPRKDLVP